MKKRILAWMIASVLALALIGCGGSKSKPDDVIPAEPVAEETVEPAAEETADITDLLGTEALRDYEGQTIAILGVRSVDTEDPGGDLLRFLFGTDGNGDPGDDLYFTVEKDGQEYLMMVDGDLYGAESGVYETVTALEEDAVVDLVGYLDMASEPVYHITEVTLQ